MSVLKIPTTVEELIEWFESAFDCQAGDRMAAHGTPDGEFYPYVTYACTSRGPNTEAARAELVAAVYKAVMSDKERLVGRSPLYWRLPEKVVFGVEGDDIGIRTRIAIPGLGEKAINIKLVGLSAPVPAGA